ncbi:hypothetical protein CYMTET_19847 [Cymbomonas tetramitiformis]|uniref:Integrase catalytic domain-containing protein n=1 Tax=Cymbomonas tetramitiformis TaxID=36881 RepID=A0AAE0G583_9CHLO|nr:hypothetical protein CYMTET_19847 [Cymbomonas tetramitiformis]
MDLQGLDLGVNSEELRNSNVLSCSVNCMAGQVAAPKRPSQTTDRGRVPKSVRKVVDKREVSVKMGQLTFTAHGGPFVTSTKGYRGYTIHVDDFSDVCHFYVWKQKLEFVDALEDYHKMVRATGRVFLEEETRVEQVVYDLDVLVLHSDNDSTIVSGKTKKYCEDNAIVQRTTSPYLHENNARAETMNKFLQTKARAMLATAGLPATMWPLAMRHVVYLINRLCKAGLGMQSSLQVLNQKYDLSVLRVFGCRAYAFIDASLRSKLADRATPLIYVGHEERSTAYLLYSQDKEKVVRSGMVRFDERVDQYGKLVMSWDPSMLTPLRSLYDCEALDGNFVTAFGGTATVILELRAYVEPKGDEFTGVVKLKSAGGRTFWTPVSVFLEARVEHLELLFEFRVKLTVNSFYPLFEKVELQQSGGGEWEAAVVCATAREDHVLPYQVILERHAGVSGSAVDVCEARVRFENRHVALAAREEKLTGLPVGVTEPKGWVQLLKGPDAVQWQESDHKEECALIDVKKAIAPVESVPAGEKVMRMTAVYKAKLDSAGEVTERKTRWVVCGNGQQHGVHYEDVYAPCTQLSTLRILIQLSLVLGLLVFALDVITCFLNGELDVYTPMYVSWPNARTVRGVLYGMLQKSVYGLKQAPRIWYKTSKNFLLAYDSRLRVSNIDPCLFYIWQLGTLVVFVYVHVDDYTVFTSSVEWKVEFFKAFSEKYPSKDKGPLVELLGMRLTFSDYGLVRECQISQVGLIQRMLERYSMQDCNPCMTPMEPRLSLLPVDSEEKLEKLPYVNLLPTACYSCGANSPPLATRAAQAPHRLPLVRRKLPTACHSCGASSPPLATRAAQAPYRLPLVRRKLPTAPLLRRKLPPLATRAAQAPHRLPLVRRKLPTACHSCGTSLPLATRAAQAPYLLPLVRRKLPTACHSCGASSPPLATRAAQAPTACHSCGASSPPLAHSCGTSSYLLPLVRRSSHRLPLVRRKLPYRLPLVRRKLPTACYSCGRKLPTACYSCGTSSPPLATRAAQAPYRLPLVRRKLPTACHSCGASSLPLATRAAQVPHRLPLVRRKLPTACHPCGASSLLVATRAAQAPYRLPLVRRKLPTACHSCGANSPPLATRMLLAAPITAAFKIFFESVETTRPLAKLLGGSVDAMMGEEDEEYHEDGTAVTSPLTVSVATTALMADRTL